MKRMRSGINSGLNNNHGMIKWCDVTNKLRQTSSRNNLQRFYILFLFFCRRETWRLYKSDVQPISIRLYRKPYYRYLRILRQKCASVDKKKKKKKYSRYLSPSWELINRGNLIEMNRYIKSVSRVYSLLINILGATTRFLSHREHSFIFLPRQCC